MKLISLSRIWAVMLRHFLLQFRDESRLANFLYWPSFDVLIWSFMSSWAAQNSSGVLFIPVVGSFFWQTTGRTSADIALSFMDELLSKNIINMFSSPIHFTEYIVGLILVCSIRIVVILIVCGLIIWYLTGFNVLVFDWWLVPLLLSLFISGLVMAFISCATLLRWGMRAIELVWIIAWSTSAFIGAFYPLNILPPAMQTIGAALPMTYAFKAVHHFVATGSMSTTLLGISFALNGVYALGALWVLKRAYNAACENGLSRLEVD